MGDNLYMRTDFTSQKGEIERMPSNKLYFSAQEKIILSFNGIFNEEIVNVSETSPRSSLQNTV